MGTSPAVLAVGAHPDDIEFMMAGTLIRLVQAGWQAHCLTIANGSCGTATESVTAIVERRQREAQEACAVIGAAWHGGFCADLEILYSPDLVRRILAVIRGIRPRIMLVPSPQDYMDDHITASRLAVTAAFARGMPNFHSVPPIPPDSFTVTLYHALPYGLKGPLREPVQPDLFIDIAPAMELKTRMLSCHRSQRDWLDHSQGLGTYIETMKSFSREAGRISGRHEYAEGWRRRSHFGFCGPDDDPLAAALAL